MGGSEFGEQEPSNVPVLGKRQSRSGNVNYSNMNSGDQDFERSKKQVSSEPSVRQMVELMLKGLRTH
jgi:hypothetical protein